jgi:hypothetical protein
MREMTDALEPPSEILTRALRIAENGEARPASRSIPWPRLAAAAILPLLILAVFLAFRHERSEKVSSADTTQFAKISYMELTVTHYTGPTPQDWSTKRTYVKKSKGEAGSLILELTKTL